MLASMALPATLTAAQRSAAGGQQGLDDLVGNWTADRLAGWLAGLRGGWIAPEGRAWQGSGRQAGSAQHAAGQQGWVGAHARTQVL